MSWEGLLLQFVVAAVPAGGLYALLRLGPERRKLASEAKVQDATAADLLTGRALEMVQHAETRAEHAEEKAGRADRRASEAQALAEQAGRRARRAEEEAADALRRYGLLERRVEQLTAFIKAQGMTPPPWDRRLD